MVGRLLFSITFYFVSVYMMAQDMKWKVIDTEIGSFEIPFDWRNPETNLKENEYHKRVIRTGEHIWSMLWKNRYESVPGNPFRDIQQITIHILFHSDGEKMSTKKAQRLLYEDMRRNRILIFESANDICYKYIYDSADMDGTMRNWTEILYYREYEGRVLCVSISSQTHNFEEITDLESRFLHIIKSFKVTSN